MADAQDQPRILTLAAEIRNQIYEEVAHQSLKIIVHDGKPSGPIFTLAAVCRQVNDEYLPVVTKYIMAAAWDFQLHVKDFEFGGIINFIKGLTPLPPGAVAKRIFTIELSIVSKPSTVTSRVMATCGQWSKTISRVSVLTEARKEYEVYVDWEHWKGVAMSMLLDEVYFSGSDHDKKGKAELLSIMTALNNAARLSSRATGRDLSEMVSVVDGGSMYGEYSMYGGALDGDDVD